MHRLYQLSKVTVHFATDAVEAASGGIHYQWSNDSQLLAMQLDFVAGLWPFVMSLLYQDNMMVSFRLIPTAVSFLPMVSQRTPRVPEETLRVPERMTRVSEGSLLLPQEMDK